MKTLSLLFAVAVLAISLHPAEALGADAPYNLLCEGKANPMGIDVIQPRFSWWVNEGLQAGYEIRVTTEGDVVWESGKVDGDASIWVEYEGKPLNSRRRYEWQVRTWNEKGAASEWSEPAWFEMGLLEQDEWRADWIGHPERTTLRSVPPVYLRKDFELEGGVKRARLYISARGIFEASLNGERVGEDIFAPGWTDYAKRNQYMSYDVTAMLKDGENAMGIILADGWHNGNLMWQGMKNWYGTDTSILAQLEIQTEAGAQLFICTDGTWKVATGPILESDFYNGEKYDARAEMDGWNQPGFDAKDWLPPRLETTPTGKLVAKVVEPVRRQEILKPVSMHQAPDGEWIYDFGQNLVGWVKITMQGDIRTTATLRYSEMLQADGSLYVENMRSAEVTDRYTFKDEEPVEWEPKFTFHGFRYLGVSGLLGGKGPGTVEAVVLNTDAPMTGEFSCSNPLLNQLQSNIVWGQKGNYLEVPTDCPQRDERLGWTGDAQVFVRTATYNMNVSPFFEKWMTDMRDAQLDNGLVPVIIPRLEEDGSSPAWSDAITICPTVIYERYGNERILRENFEAMKAWTEYQRENSHDLIFPKQGVWAGFGDWLAVDAPEPGAAPTPKRLIGTAYFAHGAHLVAEAAEVLGLPEEAKRYRALSEEVKAAFLREFVNADGRLKKETQTGYLLALGFDLLPDQWREPAVDILVEDIESRGWHLSTGFVGTGLLMPVLSKAGRNDVAYRVLLQETYPGWLYSIRQGATTMWERWNSYSHEDGFGDAGMNSFNHYAYGAVGEWMYSVIAGIDALKPGFKQILIRPQPGGGLTWAKGMLESPYGVISTNWTLEDGIFELEAVIPPNTSALVELPNGERQNVGPGEFQFRVELE